MRCSIHWRLEWATFSDSGAWRYSQSKPPNLRELLVLVWRLRSEGCIFEIMVVDLENWRSEREDDGKGKRAAER